MPNGEYKNPIDAELERRGEERGAKGGDSWLRYVNPLHVIPRGMEGTLGMIGATLTYPFRKPPSEWLKGPFGPAGYEEYQQWKGGPTEPYIPMGVPSWSQWGEWLGLAPGEPGYQQAKMGMGEMAEFAPFLFMGGGAPGVFPKAGEMLGPKKALFGLKAPPPQAITKKQAAQLLQKQIARGEEPLPELVEKVAPKAIKPPVVREPVVNKLTELIKVAKPARGKTAALRREELAKRVAIGARILEKGEGREAFLKAMKPLKGELPMAEFVPPELKFTQTEITELYNLIRSSELRFFEKLRTRTGLDKLLMEGRIPQQKEIELLESVFGTDLIKAIMKKQPFGKKAWWLALDIAGIPRAILASWDLSAPMRQGLVLGVRHPKEWLQSYTPMFKAFGSERHSLIIDANMRKRPFFNLAEDSGLYIAPLARREATRLTAREEMYMTRFTGKIPLIRRSERAFIVYLNELRTRTWETLVPMWERLGATTNDYRGLAEFINWATGRGSLGAVRPMGPLMNATLFSPRLLMSRLELPAKLISSSPMVRKEAWQTLMAFMGFGTFALSSIKLLGGEIELDPRSSDFAKAKVGNTRLDFWAGYVQFARFMAQLVTAQRKQVQGGRLQELNRWEVADRFMRTKYSPVIGLFRDLMEGTTFLGEEITIEATPRQAFQKLAPLFVQDMVDAIQTDGLMGAAVAWPGAFGVGIISYEPRRGGRFPSVPSLPKMPSLP